MAGSLIQISKDTLGSEQGSSTITGIDTTYDVYIMTFKNVIPSVADADLQFRFTESGTANSTANYDRAIQYLRTDIDFLSDTSGVTNDTKMFLTGSMENDTGTGGSNGVMYIFNANNSSEYTYATLENMYLAEGGTMLGSPAGFVFTVTSSVDGGQFFFDSGNIRSGAEFVLYGLKK